MPSKLKPFVVSEADEQAVLAAFLDMTGLLWNHTPNESYGVGPIVGKRLKAQGVKPGVPDVMIYEYGACELGPTAPVDRQGTIRTSWCGVAIELKRRNGVPSDVSKHQRKWLDDLERREWLVRVCYGARDAIGWLRSLGIGNKR